MSNILGFEFYLVLRLIVAGVFGALIGLEREYRAKEAGIRTHFFVCLGSALFMLVSQYGFSDALNTLLQTDGGDFPVRADVSRVASQIVSGIGFIGAGTIILQKRFVVGLTTAAGLWTTAAIGMAVGGGLYLLAAVTATMCFIGFEWLRRLSNVHRITKEIKVVFIADTEELGNEVIEHFRKNEKTLSAYLAIRENGHVRISVTIGIPDKSETQDSIYEYILKKDGVTVESVE